MDRSTFTRVAAAASVCLAMLLTSHMAAAAEPHSAWLQGEQARFAQVLGARRADVLIVPFQVAGYGFDPAERLLMATQLSDALAAGTKLTFADPVLAGRALGEGLRAHDESRMRDLAARMHARYLVIGSAAHDRRLSFNVDIRVLRRSEAGVWQEAGRKTWQSMPLKDDSPPYQAMPSMAPAIAEILLSKMTAPRPSTVSSAAPGRLPPLDQVASGAQPINVHVAELLAMSYPRTPEGPVERAWIRSLRLANSSAIGPGQRLAVARALLHLDRRPAAIAALGAPRNDAENALRSVMDGNLPDAERHARKITDPVLRLLALVEIRDLREAYFSADRDAMVGVLRTIEPTRSDWNLLLTSRLVKEGSIWGGENAVAMASRYGRLLDNPELSTKQLEDAAESQGEDARPFSLIHRMLAAYDNELRSFNAPADGADMYRWLVLDLMQAQVVASLMADAYATVDTRDLPDEGHKLLASQEPILGGHPDFEAMLANLAWREYARWRDKQREKWQVQALSRTRNAYALSGKATAAIRNAERRAGWTREIATQLQPLRMDNFWTWPVQSAGLTDAVIEDSAALHWYADRAVLYATTEYSMLDWLGKNELLADRKSAIAKAMQGRFDGSADFARRRASELLSQDNPTAAEVVLKRYVDARLSDFGPYEDYLDLLVSQGRHAEGYKMILRHPLLDSAAHGNGVAASNHAGAAAYYFWHTGKFEFAIPLLERSAGYESGSALSLTSEAMLALYARDFDRAARIQMQIARRYSDLNALAKYFDLIFALGRTEEAWRIYQEVYRDGNGGRVLNAIARHARQIGWSDPQTIDWLATPKNAVLADGTYFYAPRAALSAAIIDRNSATDLPGILRRFDAPSPYVVDTAKGKILRRQDPKRPASARPAVCGPSRYGNGPAGGMAKIDKVDSSLVYFAAGYQALQRRKFDEAFRQLDSAARLFEFYDAECEAVSYMAPYLALAAAHTGNTATLRDYLRAVKYRDRNLNYNLSLAVLAAFEGRHVDAEKYLDAALNRWTSNNYQTLPAEYVYADVLERMLDHTRNPVYRKRLVQWARLRQRIGPSDAWAYNLEYRHSEVAADRQAALGMALFLDPRSMPKGVSEPEAAAARALVKQANPFVMRKGKATASTG